MISMNLHQANAIIGGTLAGKPIQFRGISTDSRKNCNGTLFVALKGENFNGEDFCRQAIANGAVAILVSQACDEDVPQIICRDSLQSLTILSKYWAKQSRAKIIAITGSNGKTTVKNMIYSILRLSNKCSATRGNLNNEIGVPLSLCAIKADDDFAVIEMGAAQTGDISHLVSLVDIHTAVLTTLSAAHIGRFGSFENIMHEKMQIFSTLKEHDFAILPRDAENFSLLQSQVHATIISFGKHKEADVKLKELEALTLPVAGAHNLYNAACAKAIAYACGVEQADIIKGLENFKPASGRLENLGKINGNTVINDSYNANVQSFKAAIDVLAQYEGSTTLIVGDMAELGEQTQSSHEEIGHYAKNKNISHLLTVGTSSQKTAEVFAENSFHFTDLRQLQHYLQQNWHDLGTILIKGSRSMHLEKVIKGILSSEKVA